VGAVRKLAAVAVVTGVLAGACGSSRPAAPTVLKIVTHAPTADENLGQKPFSDDPLRMTVTQVDGYACFMLTGVPVTWPDGSYAQVGPGDQAQVRNADGGVLFTNGTVYTIEIYMTAVNTSPCPSAGSPEEAYVVESATPGESR
jgi:hypothetical protein